MDIKSLDSNPKNELQLAKLRSEHVNLNDRQYTILNSIQKYATCAMFEKSSYNSCYIVRKNTFHR